MSLHVRCNFPRANFKERISKSEVDTPSHSRGARRPSYASNLSLRRQRAQGRPGASAHPWPVCIGRKHTVVTTGGAGSSGLPCAMVLTVSFVLSPVTSSFLPPSPRGLKAHPTPGRADTPPRDLTPATGARTTRLRRPLQRRSSARRPIAHEKSPCDHLSRADAAASTASRAPRP
jgi:hypothetical protein